VLEAAVVGQAHDAYGEVPVAYVSPPPERDASADELPELCTNKLTKFKIPVSITIVDALPKNAVGKIDKPALRTLPGSADTAAKGA
jgi:acyl-coenzyme A synthetase/AMP-(fatty) acid ligase